MTLIEIEYHNCSKISQRNHLQIKYKMLPKQFCEVWKNDPAGIRLSLMFHLQLIHSLFYESCIISFWKEFLKLKLSGEDQKSRSIYHTEGVLQRSKLRNCTLLFLFLIRRVKQLALDLKQRLCCRSHLLARSLKCRWKSGY